MNNRRDKINDIIDGIAKIRIAFMSANLKPPSVILLESHDEGMRFLSSIRQDCYWTASVGSPELGRVVEMADGSAYMELKVLDIAVRWPANSFAMPDGKWSYA